MLEIPGENPCFSTEPAGPRLWVVEAERLAGLTGDCAATQLISAVTAAP